MTAGNDLPSSSRALVPVAADASQEAPARATTHRVAAFLTHVIATARKVPQTCERRRAEPDEVIAAYRATIEKLQKLNEKI